MKLVKFPFSYYFKEIYHDANMIGGFECGAIYKAAKDNKHYLIIDKGAPADFLDEDDRDILDQLIKIIEFEIRQEIRTRK